VARQLSVRQAFFFHWSRKADEQSDWQSGGILKRFPDFIWEVWFNGEIADLAQ
jgi:hypothetical protein